MANAVIDALSNPDMMLGDDEDGEGMEGLITSLAGMASGHTTMHLLPQASPAVVRTSGGNNRYSASHEAAAPEEQALPDMPEPTASDAPQVRGAAVDAWPEPAPAATSSPSTTAAVGEAASARLSVRDSLALQRVSRAAALRASLRASIHATKALIEEAWAEPVCVAPDTPLPSGFAPMPEGEEGEESEACRRSAGACAVRSDTMAAKSPAPRLAAGSAHTPSRTTPLSHSAAWADRRGASLGSLAKAAASMARASTGSAPNKLLAAMDRAGADTQQAPDNARA